MTFSQNLSALAALLRAPFHISHIKQFPLQPCHRKKIGFVVVTDNTKGAGRKIREKGGKEMVEIRVFSFMGSLIFFGMEKKVFILNPNINT